MNCNGTRPSIYVVFFLMIVLLHTSSCQQKQKEKNNDDVDNSLVGTKGDLYEVFKKRLEKFNSEMSLNTDGLFDEKRSKTHIADEKRSTVRECLYEEYKKRLDKINNELSLDGEKVFDRSGRNTIKESAARSGPSVVKSQIEEVLHALINDNMLPVAPDNIIKNKNAEIGAKDKGLNQVNSKTSQRIVDGDDLLKNKDLGKLQTGEHALENPVIDDILTNNKLGNPNSENMDKKSNEVKLLIPDVQLNKAKLITTQNNEPILKDTTSTICRRQTEESTVDKGERDTRSDEMSAELIPTDLSPSYPGVLTKGINPNMIPAAHGASTLLNSVASKLKTSPLDLAKKLATATDGSTNIKNDPKLTKLLQKYIESSVNVNSNGRTAKDTAADVALTESLCMPQDLPHYQITAQPQNSPPPQIQTQCPLPGPVQTLEYNSVSNILEKVLTKLEQIQESKPDNMSDKFCEVEGAPCEVLGIWNSYVMGLRFGIKSGSGNGSKRRFDAKCAEPENIVLNIDVQETTPPKLHQIMDTGWKFTGSSMKQLGGPFFIISETRTQNVLATFAGYCRTCGSMDTIFGSWTFVFPSKDCQDITVAVENKRDIFRRDLLDAKIGERYNSANCEKGKKGKCIPKHK